MAFWDDVKSGETPYDLASMIAKLKGQSAPVQQPAATPVPPVPSSGLDPFTTALNQKAAVLPISTPGNIDDAQEKAAQEQVDMEEAAAKTPIAPVRKNLIAPKEKMVANTPAKDAKLPEDDLQAIKEGDEEDKKNKDYEDQIKKEDEDAASGIDFDENGNPIDKNDDELSLDDENEEETPKKSEDKIQAKPLTLAERFKQAQEAKAHAQDAAMWSKLGARLGGAIAKASPDVVKGNEQMADMIAQRGNRPMEQLQQQIEFQKQDPNSDYSKSARDFLKEKFNVNLPEGINVSQLDSTFMGPALKSFEADQNRQMTMNKIQSEHDFKDAELKQNLEMKKAQLAEREANHQDSTDIKRQMLAITQAMADNKADAADDKKQQVQDKNYSHTVDLLETARGNPAVQQAEKDIYASQKANDLISSMGGDPNKLSSQQVNLLVSEIGKIASGGKPSMHEMDMITPTTLRGTLGRYASMLTNKPTPANAGAFLKQYQDYAKELTNGAHKVITDKYGRVIDSRAGLHSDDQNNLLKQKYLGRFEQPEQQSVVPAPQTEMSPDVLSYAQTHNITPEEALSIKNQRMGK